MGLAPYWWPDPKSPTGRPYIRRDGERNPEISQIPNHRDVGRLTSATYTLALAAYLFQNEDYAAQQWFADYVGWMTTSANGQQERDAKNNHGTCWVMQVAEFARFTGNQELTSYCRDRFKTVLVNQIARDGSFPQELRRTKAYGYSLFNLDAMATVCQILSTPGDNLWNFELPDGRGMKKAMATCFRSWPSRRLGRFRPM